MDIANAHFALPFTAFKLLTINNEMLSITAISKPQKLMFDRLNGGKCYSL